MFYIHAIFTEQTMLDPCDFKPFIFIFLNEEFVFAALAMHHQAPPQTDASGVIIQCSALPCVSFGAFALSFILRLTDRTMATLEHLFVCPAESYTTQHLKALHAAETSRRLMNAPDYSENTIRIFRVHSSTISHWGQ